MLGHTHMGIGAVGAVVATPFVLHTHWETMRQFFGDNWHTIPHVIIAEAILVVAAVIGAIIPDLDQQNSLMARKIEFIGAWPILGMLVAAVVAVHKETSPIAWVMVVVMTMLFGAARNATRMIGLGLIGAGLLYLGWDKHIPLVAAVVLAVWIVGAMFTKHRTFTHSLPGLILFSVGVWMSLHTFHAIHLDTAAIGLIVGYALHMAADAVAGGVPLFWPWSKRQGVRLVKTGGGMDYLIGGVCAFGFIALAVL